MVMKWARLPRGGVVGLEVLLRDLIHASWKQHLRHDVGVLRKTRVLQLFGGVSKEGVNVYWV